MCGGGVCGLLITFGSSNGTPMLHRANVWRWSVRPTGRTLHRHTKNHEPRLRRGESRHSEMSSNEQSRISHAEESKKSTKPFYSPLLWTSKGGTLPNKPILALRG